MKQAILEHLATLGPLEAGTLAYDLAAEVYEINSDLRVLQQMGEVVERDGVWAVAKVRDK